MMKKFEINKLSNIRRIIARRVFIYQETICFGGIQTKVTSLFKTLQQFSLLVFTSISRKVFSLEPVIFPSGLIDILRTYLIAAERVTFSGALPSYRRA
jgi:hypothetical protein